MPSMRVRTLMYYSVCMPMHNIVYCRLLLVKLLTLPQTDHHMTASFPNPAAPLSSLCSWAATIMLPKPVELKNAA